MKPTGERVDRLPPLLAGRLDLARYQVFRDGYLTDITSFSSMNAACAKYFDQPYPSRTTIGVATLPPGAVGEVDLVVQDAPCKLGEAM